MLKNGNGFVQGIRTLSKDVVEWEDFGSFLLPTREPETMPEVFLIMTNPVYGIGVHLCVDGRITYYRKLVEWAAEAPSSPLILFGQMMGFVSTQECVQAPPLVSPDQWVGCVHQVLQDMHAGRLNIEFDLERRTLRVTELDLHESN